MFSVAREALPRPGAINTLKCRWETITLRARLRDGVVSAVWGEWS